MTPQEAIDEVDQYSFLTMTEKLAALVAVLPKIEIPQAYRPPTCQCGIRLDFWTGRHTGLTWVKHPGSHIPCPRAGTTGMGATPHDALLAYFEAAPDMEEWLEARAKRTQETPVHPVSSPSHPVSDDDFSGEFQP